MQLFLRGLQIAAFLAVVHFNSVYQWTPNGYAVALLGVGAAWLLTTPFMAYAKIQAWLLSRKQVARSVVVPPLRIHHESALRPDGSRLRRTTPLTLPPRNGGGGER